MNHWARSTVSSLAPPVRSLAALHPQVRMADHPYLQFGLLAAGEMLSAQSTCTNLSQPVLTSAFTMLLLFLSCHKIFFIFDITHIRNLPFNCTASDGKLSGAWEQGYSKVYQNQSESSNYIPVGYMPVCFGHYPLTSTSVPWPCLSGSGFARPGAHNPD